MGMSRPTLPGGVGGRWAGRALSSVIEPVAPPVVSVNPYTGVHESYR